MVDRVKNFLRSGLITVQHLVVVCHTVCVHVRGPNNFGGRCGPVPLERGWGWPLETCYFPACYHTKLGHNRSNHLDAGRRSQKFGGHWKGWHTINTLLCTCVIPTFITLGQTGWATAGVPKIWEILGPHSIAVGTWLVP